MDGDHFLCFVLLSEHFNETERLQAPTLAVAMLCIHILLWSKSILN